MSKKRSTLGWREWVALPELGLARIEAKIDTGARTSTLHARDIEPFRRHGADWVRFVSAHVSGAGDDARWIEARMCDRRSVRSSSGRSELRYVIETVLEIGAESLAVDLTLTDRSRMRYPLLVGRTAIAGRFVVDAEKTHLLGD